MKKTTTDFVERISLSFPNALLEAIDLRAKAEGRTRSGQISFVLRNVVRRNKTTTRRAD